jgi:hypothetical protein
MATHDTHKELIPLAYFIELAREPLTEEELNTTIEKIEQALANDEPIETSDEDADLIARHISASAHIIKTIGVSDESRYIIINGKVSNR